MTKRLTDSQKTFFPKLVKKFDLSTDDLQFTVEILMREIMLKKKLQSLTFTIKPDVSSEFET